MELLKNNPINCNELKKKKKVKSYVLPQRTHFIFFHISNFKNSSVYKFHINVEAQKLIQHDAMSQIFYFLDTQLHQLTSRLLTEMSEMLFR